MATINGTAGNDTLLGTASTDTISGLGGNDRLQGNGGNDTVLGGAGNDTVRGNDGTDWIEGGAGNDNVGGGSGQDSFVFREAGSTHADVFNDFSSGWDNIQLDAAFFTTLGAAGQFTSGDARFWSSGTGTAHDADDRILYNTSTRQLWYDADGNGSGTALLIGTLNTGATVVATDIHVFGTGGGGSGQTINGTAGNDSLVGGSGNDTIHGFAGEDTIDGGAGADSMVGGAHPDTYFVDNPGDVIVELEDGGFDTVNASVSYTLAAWVNNLNLTGTAAINGIGNELPNVISGNTGDNSLVGGAGNDTLSGGAGSDSFVMNQAPGAANADVLADFVSQQDKIILDGAVLANTGPSGNFSEFDGRLWAAFGATSGHEADDRVIYNRSTGELYYDADGSGPGASQLIATVADAGLVRASDFVVINGGGTLDGHLTGTAGDDNLAGGDGNDTLEGLGGNDLLRGNGGSDFIDGGTGNDVLNGGSLSSETDTLLGGDGNDTLNGEGGADSMDGGMGNDQFVVDTTDVLTDPGGFDTIHVGTAGEYTMPGFAEALFVSFGSPSIIGNELNNQITGWFNADRLDGRGGNDFLDGGDDNDTLIGGEGADLLLGGNHADVLDGGIGNDSLDGGAHQDRLYGGLGTDSLSGGADADEFLFDQPNAAHADLVADFQSSLDTIVLDGAGLAAIGPSGNFTSNDARFWAATGASSAHDADDRIIYNTLTGDLYYDEDGTGSAAAQRMATLQGAPTLSSTDIAVINGSGTPNGVVINGTSGDDSLVGGPGDDTINGLDGSDTLVGNAGNDSLDGGDGSDSLSGGLGNDTFVVTAGDVLSEVDGIDLVISKVDWTLGAGFENLVLDADGVGRMGFGNDLDNEMLGNGLSNFLDGRAGNDRLFGGDGDDNIWASTGNDYMSGGAGRDTFSIGASITPGGYGQDTIDGGAGEQDAIDFDQTSALSVDLAAGTLTGGLPGSATVLGIEWFFVTDSADVFDDRIIGNASANHLAAGAGNDSVAGGAGNDTMHGDAGNDTLTGGSGSDVFRYIRDSAGAPNADQITDFASGQDIFWLDSRTFNVGGFGRFTSGDERFYAAAGANAGHDATDRVVYDTTSGDLWIDVDGSGSTQAALLATLQPGTALAATDFFVENAPMPWFFQGGPQSEMAFGGELDDTMNGGGGNDYLVGNGGNDQLDGENGDDTLEGGLGNDSVVGGTGADLFRFATTPGSANADQVADFVSVDDQVALDGGVYAGVGALGTFDAADARFWSSTTGLAHDADDRVVYNTSNGQLWYDADGNGSGAAQLIATMGGAPSLTAADITVTTGSGSDTSSGGSVINGTSGDDSLGGTAANDTINGFAGEDTIDGGPGADSMTGGDHPDIYFVDNAGDVIVEFEDGGFDTVNASASYTLAAWVNNLTLVGTAAIDGTGNELPNVITGNSSNNNLLGGAGSDDLSAGGGSDTLDGGVGNDLLAGGGGLDSFAFSVAAGAANTDQISDFVSADDQIVLDGAVHAGSGPSGNFAASDARFWSSGAGVAHDGDDRVIYNSSNGQLWYDADGNGGGAAQLIATLQGAPTLTAADITIINGSSGGGSTINGTSGNDTLSGTAGDDTINGLGGNDLINAGSTGGADVINGGDGRDSIEFKAAATSAVVVDFNAGTITGGSAGGSISFTSIERVVAGNFNDHLTGDAGAQNLAGQAGADTLTGGGGNDTLWGGTGNDVFVFREMGTANADRISDWASGADSIHLDDAGFAAIGAMGDFTAGDARFKANSSGTATDASDRVIFNTSTGQLYYDADGSGGGAMQLIATVQGGASLAATDITVI